MDTRWSINDFYARRANTVGSSDIPVILGISPYKTPLDLYKLKTGEVLPDAQNYAQMRGTQMEPKIREWFNKRMMKTFEPKNFVHKEIKEFTCSMDGFCEETKEGVEIKYPGKDDHGIAKLGKIPEHYLAQVHWQYIVSESDLIYYVSYKEDDEIVIPVEKPTEKRVLQLIKEAGNFIEMVKMKIPPQITSRDYVIASSSLSSLYVEKQKQIKLLENEIEEIRSNLILEAQKIGHNKIDFGLVTVDRSIRKGAVDYKLIKELDGVDIEKYRGKSTEFYTIRVK